jgi:choline dehydrogenase-like flavoprotein
MAFESISPQNGSSASPRSFDAIVVGGGASGGVAALTLGEAGLNVLVLDAGWDLSFTDTPWRWFENYVLSRSADPRLMDVLPAAVIRRARQLARLGGRIRQPIQSQCYAWERLPGVFVDDIDHPYETRGGADFSWLRVHALGGRMIVPGHGRQYYRFPGNVFRPTTNEKPAWPMSLEELVPHRRRRNPHCTSVVEDPLQPTGDEQDLLNVAKACASDADPMLSQFAAPLNTIAMASALPSVRIRRGALVRHVNANGAGKVSGVTWYDREEDRILEASAPIVFLCAGALESTRILMTSAEISTSSAFGSRSTALGRNLMDHVIMKADGVGAELRDPSFHPPDGRCVYVPNVSEACSSIARQAAKKARTSPGSPLQKCCRDRKIVFD